MTTTKLIKGKPVKTVTLETMYESFTFEEGVEIVVLVVVIDGKDEDEGCPDCGSPYPSGKLEAHFMGCPREKKL